MATIEVEKFLDSGLAMSLAQHGWDVVATPLGNEELSVDLFKRIKNSLGWTTSELHINLPFSDSLDGRQQLKKNLQNVVHEFGRLPSNTTQAGRDDEPNETAVALYENNRKDVCVNDVAVNVEWVKSVGNHMQDYAEAGVAIKDSLIDLSAILEPSLDAERWYDYCYINTPIFATAEYDSTPIACNDELTDSEKVPEKYLITFLDDSEMQYVLKKSNMLFAESSLDRLANGFGFSAGYNSNGLFINQSDIHVSFEDSEFDRVFDFLQENNIKFETEGPDEYYRNEYLEFQCKSNCYFYVSTDIDSNGLAIGGLSANVRTEDGEVTKIGDNLTAESIIARCEETLDLEQKKDNLSI